jgi:taurine dioxygenase
MPARAPLDVQPLSAPLGAEVRGVDLRDLDDDTWAAIHAAWLERLVLFFPDQHLSPDEQVAFARRFGTPDVRPYLPKLSDEHQEIVVLDSDAGEVTDYWRADHWHTDVSFAAAPPQASILQMEVCPATGGDTMWSNQYLAYELLSEPLRDLLDGLSAVHEAAHVGTGRSAEHPVVRVHPETGRKSLFVNRTSTSHFVQLRPGESDALLHFLCDFSEQPRFQCRYRWSAGTVAVWDNRCTQHYAIFDFDGRRVIHRVTVLGDVPRGEPPRWPAIDADDAEQVRAQAAMVQRQRIR